MLGEGPVVPPQCTTALLGDRVLSMGCLGDSAGTTNARLPCMDQLSSARVPTEAGQNPSVYLAVSATRLGGVGLGSCQNKRAAIRYMPIIGIRAE